MRTTAGEVGSRWECSWAAWREEWSGLRDGNSAHKTFQVFFFYFLIFLSYFNFKSNLKFKFPNF
jgi:hypothetical protein